MCHSDDWEVSGVTPVNMMIRWFVIPHCSTNGTVHFVSSV